MSAIRVGVVGAGGRIGGGQMVAIMPEGSRGFLLAVARWSRLTGGNELQAGIQIMPGNPACVALRGTGLLPEAVRRAPKRPFYLAVEQEHGGGFRRFVDEALSEAAVRRRGLFQPRFVAALRDRAGRDLLVNKQLMALALFELWARLYLDGAWRNFDPGGGA